jgi:hypothetical protein
MRRYRGPQLEQGTLSTVLAILRARPQHPHFTHSLRTDANRRHGFGPLLRNIFEQPAVRFLHGAKHDPDGLVFGHPAGVNQFVDNDHLLLCVRCCLLNPARKENARKKYLLDVSDKSRE